MKNLFRGERLDAVMKSRYGRDLIVPTMLMVLANAPFWLLSTRFFILRPVFNINTSLAVILACVGWWTGVVALAVTWSFDALQSMSLIYHFHTAGEFLQTFQFAGLLGWANFITSDMLLVTMPFIAALGAIGAILRRYGAPLRSIMVMAVVMTLLDTVNGSATMTGFDVSSRRGALNTTRSGHIAPSAT